MDIDYLNRALKIAEEYYEFRGYKTPNATQAVKFLATEVGELIDAHTRLEDGWVRNNTKSDNELIYELGDCFMMWLMVYRVYLTDECTNLTPITISSVDEGFIVLLGGVSDLWGSMTESSIFRDCRVVLVLEILMALADIFDTDLMTAMISKFKSKGFTPEN